MNVKSGTMPTKIEEQIKEIHIENFKCFEKFTIRDLNRINIFYGDNDSGKTSLLEAIYIALSNVNPGGIFAVLRNFPVRFVEGSPEDTWDLLFFRFNRDKAIKLKITFENDDKLESTLSKPFLYKEITIRAENLIQSINPHSLFIRWQFGETFRESIINFINPQIEQKSVGMQQSMLSLSLTSPNVISFGALTFTLKPVFYFTSKGKPFTEALTTIYGDIVKENLKEILLESLREIKPELEKIDTINLAGVPCVAVKFKGDNNYYPIDVTGEGFSKIFMIISLIIKNRNGILLIDEIENGLYWKVQPVFWKYLEKFAIDFNVQLFITTHSYELLGNIIKSTQNPDYISGFTMKKTKGNIEYLSLKGKDFIEMIKAGYEVR